MASLLTLWNIDMTYQQVASTILKQLGSSTFMTVTGANNFIATEQGLQFDLPNTKTYVRRNISRVHVIRECDETYTLKGFRFRNREASEVVSQSGILGAKLVDAFEEMTNLTARF